VPHHGRHSSSDSHHRPRPERHTVRLSRVLPRIMCFWAAPSSRTQRRKIKDLRARRKQGFWASARVYLLTMMPAYIKADSTLRLLPGTVASGLDTCVVRSTGAPMRLSFHVE
jgi:hypothetical protein